MASQTHEQLRATCKRDLAFAYRLFAACGWGDLGDGHISGRDPERTDCFWLLKLGISFHLASPANLVLVGPDGNLVDADARHENAQINRSAYFIHHPIHDVRTDVHSVAHVHTPWGTPFSAEARLIETISQESCLFFEDHVLFDDEEVQIQDCAAGQRIATTLGGASAAILRNHGLLTVGSSVAESVGLFLLFERAAEAQMKARAAKPISAESARYARQDLVRIGSAEAAFNSAVQRHLGTAK